MDNLTTEQLSQLPEEMLRFTLQKVTEATGPRLGTLAFQGRNSIQVPNFLGNTSRGVVSHLTPDNYHKNTQLKGVYVALEDFIERAPKDLPAIYQFHTPNGESPLRRYIALSNESILVLGARRVPPVPCPAANTNKEVQIYTSTGFRSLPVVSYTSAVKHIKPDIVIALGDVPPSLPPSRKRADRMPDRTLDWLKDIISGRTGFDKTSKDIAYNIFAPILPISRELQTWYLDQLVDDLKNKISGLAIYDSQLLLDLPEELQDKPRLSLGEPASPNKILYEVSLGMDLFIIPFVGAATDAGIALNFQFPVPSLPEQESERRPLGIDMWRTEHATDISPLSEGCQCYACKNHHRAYLQHLLEAKEMLGWVLLQFHNHHILDEFFAGIRSSIVKGTFEEERRRFEGYYEPELPDQTGQGPRVRGYQFKSDGPGERKKNPAPYNKLLEKVNPDMVEGTEAPTPDPDTVALDLEKLGFAEAEKP